MNHFPTPQQPCSTTTDLTVSPERQGVESLPCLPPASSSLVEFVTLVQATRLLAGSGQSTSFAVLVDWLDDPVDTRVLADSLVLWVDKDDFVVLVGRVLVDPVGVEDSQVGATTTDTLLSGGLKRSLVLELVDTLVNRLA